jgi:hypothetical protein
MSYKVWIEIEEVDEGGDHVQDIDPGFASSGEFDQLEEAHAFADRLQESAR